MNEWMNVGKNVPSALPLPQIFLFMVGSSGLGECYHDDDCNQCLLTAVYNTSSEV